MTTSRTAGLGIALGGGGMKGLAHIGALSVIEACGLRPDRIAGTSIGALIGGLYASGMPVAALRNMIEERALLSLISMRFDGKGLVGVAPLRKLLDSHLDAVRLEELPIPFCVVTTDLATGKRIVLDEGPAIDAILASSAIPGIFAPVEIDGRTLVDGGLCDNLPVEPLRRRGSTSVIAVRLFRQIREWRLEDAVESDRPARVREGRWFKNLHFKSLKHLPSLIAEKWLRTDDLVPDAMQIAERGLDLLIVQLEEVRLGKFAPDVLIAPDVTFVGALDFHDDKAKIFQAGAMAAESVRDDLIALKKRLDGG